MVIVFITYVQPFRGLVMRRKRQGYSTDLRLEHCSRVNISWRGWPLSKLERGLHLLMWCKVFVGTRKTNNYKEIVDELLLSLRGLECRMSIKLHYLHSHLDKFSDNLEDVRAEQGERFHKYIKVMEDRYQGRWDSHMMSDYCRSLMRANPNALHKRASSKRKFTSNWNNMCVYKPNYTAPPYILAWYNILCKCYVCVIIILMFCLFFSFACWKQN